MTDTKPPKVVTTMRLDPQTIALIRQTAKSEDRSVSAVLMRAMQFYVSRHREDEFDKPQEISAVPESCAHIWTPHTGDSRYACQKCGTPYSAETALAEPTLAEIETRRHLAELEPIEEYIRGLPWSADTPDIWKTLVSGNIHTFYWWLRKRDAAGVRDA